MKKVDSSLLVRLQWSIQISSCMLNMPVFGVVGVWPWVKMERQDLGNRKQFTKNVS